MSDREIAGRRQREASIQLRVRYEQLPKATRKELCAQFKSDRAANPALNWNDWLAGNLR
jgi:hypothetical protein